MDAHALAPRGADPPGPPLSPELNEGPLRRSRRSLRPSRTGSARSTIAPLSLPLYFSISALDEMEADRGLPVILPLVLPVQGRG